MGTYEPAHGINTTELWKRFEELESLPLKQFMEAFTRLAVRPDVVLPPPQAGAPPPWVAKRPAGVNAVLRDVERYHWTTGNSARSQTGPLRGRRAQQPTPVRGYRGQAL